MSAAPLPTVGQKPVQAAKTLGMFRPPESLNSARIERMTPSMACSENKESIDGIIRSIRALFKNSGDEIMPRVLAAFTGFWPTVRRGPAGTPTARRGVTRVQPIPPRPARRGAVLKGRDRKLEATQPSLAQLSLPLSHSRRHEQDVSHDAARFYGEAVGTYTYDVSRQQRPI